MNALYDYARQGGLPPFSRILADQVVPATERLLRELEEGQEAMERHIGATEQMAYDDIVERLADLTEPLERAWGVVSHLMGVRNSPELRAAHEVVQPAVVMTSMKLAQSQPIFRALERIEDSPTFDDLPASRRRIVEKKLLEARLSGIALDGPRRDRFNAIQQELSELATRFQNHVLDATKAWALTLTKKEEVDGLPDSFLVMASEVAKAAGEASSTPEEGPWRVTLDFPSLAPFLRFSRRRDLRERVYRANLARASELDGGAHDNRPLIERILALRAEKAHLLDFENYAHLSLASKMADSPEQIHALLHELRAVSRPVAERELRELSALAGFDVMHWDAEFYSERLREQRYAYSEEELRPYFPLPRVLDGLFALVGRLFGVTVQDATASVERWHDDVGYFRVQKDGQDIASFFLDPYARPADKRGGAWMDDCVTRRRQGGGLRLPVAYLCCNQAPPSGGKPSLMTFRDVETLFHEFGHGLQHMLSTVEDVDASGIRGVEWDAVELPSQFMENWCTHQGTLLGMTRHIDTGAALPLELFEKLKASKTFRAASMMMRQLMFATLDLELHTALRPGETAFDAQRRVAADNAVLPVLPEDRFLCSFSHIFGGGYAAGYYSYKWAEVLSADAFAAFEEAGIDDEARLREIGGRFRDTVLSLGGSVHPLEVFRRFRGRAPTTAALLRHAGLSA